MSEDFWDALVGALITFTWAATIVGLLARAAINYSDYGRAIRPFIYLTLGILLFIVGMSYVTTRGAL